MWRPRHSAHLSHCHFSCSRLEVGASLRKRLPSQISARGSFCPVTCDVIQEQALNDRSPATSDIPSVMEVLRARAAGKRDHFTVALALEGGGLRGVVSGATLIALRDAGITENIDVLYGTSSGSINLTYFAAGGSWDALSVYYDHLPFGFVRGASVRAPRLDMAFLEQVMRSRVPLDVDALRASPMEVRVVTTDVARVVPALHDMRKATDPVETLLASSWLPLLSGQPPVVDGVRSLDGGLLWADPMYAALKEGCSHVLAINTSARRSDSEHSRRLRVVLRAFLNRTSPGLGDAYLRSRAEWDRDKARLQNGVSTVIQGAAVTRFAPPAGSHQVERLTLQRDKLLDGVRAGYATGLRIAGLDAPSDYYFSIADLQAKGPRE